MRRFRKSCFRYGQSSSRVFECGRESVVLDLWISHSLTGVSDHDGHGVSTQLIVRLDVCVIIRFTVF